MSLQNRGAVLYGAKDLRVEDIPMPVINDNELLVKVECVGICGSDVKIYTEGKCGFDVITDPMVIGHEGAGVVIQVGSKVKSHKIGDRVAIEPTQPCRSCQYCKWGQYNLCLEPKYCSSMGAPGNLCRYYKHVADFCHIIPDHVTLEEAAAIQPLAIAIHACQRARVKLGAKVAIFGAGPIGVLCGMAARAMGATGILITDVIAPRLKTAKSLVADHTLLITKDQTDEETVKQIVNLLGANPDVSIDACGYESVQRVAMKATRSGGVCLIVGIGGDSANVPLSPTVLREVDIIGSFRFSNTYPTAIASVANCMIDLKSFITHHYPLDEAKEAVELCQRGEGMKVIIHTHQ